MSDPLGHSSAPMPAPAKQSGRTARGSSRAWLLGVLVSLLVAAAFLLGLAWSSGLDLGDDPPSREDLALCAARLRDAYEDLESYLGEADTGLDGWLTLTSEADRRQAIRVLAQFDDRLIDGRQCYEDISAEEAVSLIDGTRLLVADWLLIYEEMPLNALWSEQETGWYDFKVLLNLVGMNR